MTDFTVIHPGMAPAGSALQSQEVHAIERLAYLLVEALPDLSNAERMRLEARLALALSATAAHVLRGEGG